MTSDVLGKFPSPYALACMQLQPHYITAVQLALFLFCLLALTVPSRCLENNRDARNVSQQTRQARDHLARQP